MSEHNLISVDLAKNVFQLCAMTDCMSIVFNRQLKRKDLARFMATQNPVYPNIPRHISQGTHASRIFQISERAHIVRLQRFLTKLDMSGLFGDITGMQNIKISSKVDEVVWKELKALARESHQNVSGLLTEAISEYVKRKRVRPEVLNHLDASMDQNDELGKLLAR